MTSGRWARGVAPLYSDLKPFPVPIAEHDAAGTPEVRDGPAVGDPGVPGLDHDDSQVLSRRQLAGFQHSPDAVLRDQPGGNGQRHQRVNELAAAQTGRFLVDTGANVTVVDPTLIAPLGLTPKNFMPVATPTTGQAPPLRPVYDVQIVLQASVTPRIAQLGPLGVMPHLRALSIVATDMKSQGIDGLIGRDILDNVLLVYNGLTGTYTLSW
jgi:hypothetical protein